MMNRNDEIKNIMRKLRESKNESAKANSSRRAINEATDTENDASESDLILARLEDILARFLLVAGISKCEVGNLDASAV